MDVGKAVEKDTNRKSSSKKKLKELEDYDQRCKFRVKKRWLILALFGYSRTQCDTEEI